jgi:hypothetical protein
MSNRILSATQSQDSGNTDSVSVAQCSVFHSAVAKGFTGFDVWIHIFRSPTVPPDGSVPDLPPVIVPGTGGSSGALVNNTVGWDSGMAAVPLTKAGRNAGGRPECFTAVISGTEDTLTRADQPCFLTVTYS